MGVTAAYHFCRFLNLLEFTYVKNVLTEKGVTVGVVCLNKGSILVSKCAQTVEKSKKLSKNI